MAEKSDEDGVPQGPDFTGDCFDENPATSSHQAISPHSIYIDEESNAVRDTASLFDVLQVTFTSIKILPTMYSIRRL